MYPRLYQVYTRLPPSGDRVRVYNIYPTKTTLQKDCTSIEGTSSRYQCLTYPARIQNTVQNILRGTSTYHACIPVTYGACKGDFRSFFRSHGRDEFVTFFECLPLKLFTHTSLYTRQTLMEKIHMRPTWTRPHILLHQLWIEKIYVTRPVNLFTCHFTPT